MSRKQVFHDPSPRYRRLALILLLCALPGLLLASCGGAFEVTDGIGNQEPGPDVSYQNEPSEEQPGGEGTPTLSPQDRIEDWIVDLEWPSVIDLGQSDVIRLTIVPSEAGLVIEAEFADHRSTTRHIPIERPEGYLLTAVAELHAVNFDISPEGPQRRELVVGKEESWYWTIEPQAGGRQRMSLSLMMEWHALYGQQPQIRRFGSFDHGFEVQVQSVMGMSQSRFGSSVVLLSVVILVIGVLILRSRLGKKIIRTQTPNPDVRLELHGDISFSTQESNLLRTLFRVYQKVIIEKEFMSGYSGARTLMTIPVRQDQKADARTIIKISDSGSIRREYQNYQQYVKHTLPPTTARIQHQPISSPNSVLAGLRYTFIGMPGESPLGLRQALLQDPNPDWLISLADAFGPNWWLQHHPYTFQLQQEYDRKLPAHLTLTPARGEGKLLDGRKPPDQIACSPGDLVHLSHFSIKSRDPEREKISLIGSATGGKPPLRITWRGKTLPSKMVARVETTRDVFLKQTIDDFDRFGLPDPLEKLPGVLKETVQGTRSIIHGDLNLENILIGPGNILWLIDFSETREGHTLFDFAHLYVELIAHVLAEQIETPAEYLLGLEQGHFTLLHSLTEVAGRYLFNPAEVREFQLAASVSCLGALKYRNLSRHSKHLLYLTAAFLSKKL